MRKTLLVARREVMENIRTKAFWIGILAVPIMLVLSIFGSLWLKGKASVRTYAVIDRSGWLLQDVERRMDKSDLESLLQTAVRKRLTNGDLSDWPGPLRDLAEKVEKNPLAAATAFEGVFSDTAPEATSLGASLRSWWQGAGAEELRKLDNDLARARWSRVELKAGDGDPEAAAAKAVADGTLFAYIVVDASPETPTAISKYVSKNLTDTGLSRKFSDLASKAVQARRFDSAGVDSGTVASAMVPFLLLPKRLSDEGAEVAVKIEDTLRQWAPVAFVYLLWFSVLIAAQMLLTNTIEEKANRLMEVLLSSVTPLQLMTGKILGIAMTGLLILGSWVLFFILALRFGPSLLGFQVPFDLGGLVQDPIFLTSFLVYFLFGYATYSAMVAAIGSLCNTLKEAQNLWTPIMVVLILPLLSMELIGRDPNGTLAKVLSWIPPFTPFVMMNRAAGPPAVYEYVGTTILMIVTTFVTFFAAAKIFRVGVLSTGKPPKFREIMRWLRAPVGNPQK